MSNLMDLIDFVRAQAIADFLQPTEESSWRKICRSYSKNFNTPYHEVLLMPPEIVALAYFEDQIDERDPDKDLDSMMDTIYSIEDPTYEAEKNKEIKDFIKKAEKEEEERIKANKPIHPSMKTENEVSLKNFPEKALKEPASGSINLSYLANSKNET